jgi:hypothetical protein
MERLLECNPGAFKDIVSTGFPNSIEMLDPNQPFLAAIDSLRLSEQVPVHTILGTGNMLVGHGRSDGVVSIDSAVHKRSESEVRAATTHNGLLRHPSAFAELKRILALHASLPEMNSDLAGSPTDKPDPREALTDDSLISVGEETIETVGTGESINQ